jgi:hypothetical protein
MYCKTLPECGRPLFGVDRGQMLEEFIKYILGEWRVIANSPVSYAVAVLVAAAIIWWIMTWGYGREMSLLKQQVADYKDKLSGASPDQARARIDALEARLARVEPRRLTEEQRRILAANFVHAPKGAVRVSHEASCSDCNQYASDFIGAIQPLPNWKVSAGMFIGPGTRAVTGIGVRAAQANSVADAVMTALRCAQISFDTLPATPRPGNERFDVEIEIMAKS